MQVILTTLP